jgi:hypothetical protein
MIHMDRRHPELSGAANPIRQAHYSANILNHTNGNTNHDWWVPGWKHLLTRTNPYTAGVFSPHTAYSSATPFYNTPIESMFRQYEEDRQEELATKRRESERIRSRQLFEDYQTALKIRETEIRKRMGGILGFDIMSEISNQMATGRLTPVMTIDREGSISIKCELTNRENESLAANQNDLSVRQFQDILAKLNEAQAEFTRNFIKCTEARKRNLDVVDEELMQILAGGIKVSRSNNPKTELLSIDDKPRVVSRVLSRIEGKNDERYDGQEEKPSRKELGQDDFAKSASSNCEMFSSMTPPAPPPPIDIALLHIKSTASDISSEELEPLAMLIEDDEKKRRRPDQQSSRLIRPQEHFSSSQEYGVQQVRLVDEQMNEEDQRFIEGVKKIQIKAIQEKNSRKKERSIFG